MQGPSAKAAAGVYKRPVTTQGDDEDEAAKAIQRAFGIDPTYYYAASNLLGHQLDEFVAVVGNPVVGLLCAIG